jgi:hypothetical protein
LPQATVRASETVLIADAANREEIDLRVAQIKKELAETDSVYDTEKLSERIAKLAGGVAVIKVRQQKCALHLEGTLAGGGQAQASFLPGMRRLRGHCRATYELWGQACIPWSTPFCFQLPSCFRFVVANFFFFNFFFGGGGSTFLVSHSSSAALCCVVAVGVHGNGLL